VLAVLELSRNCGLYPIGLPLKVLDHLGGILNRSYGLLVDLILNFKFSHYRTGLVLEVLDHLVGT
jgi:hypothetical protein